MVSQSNVMAETRNGSVPRTIRSNSAMATLEIEGLDAVMTTTGSDYVEMGRLLVEADYL